MDSTEKKIKFPNGTTIRYYVDGDKKSLDMDDLIKAMQNPENKNLIQDVIAEFAQSTYIPPNIKVITPENDNRNLSDFNKSLLKGLNFNPKENK